MIPLLLIALTAYLAFNIGRRWTAGEDEAVTEAALEAREERGRTGGMRLRSVRIRR